MNRKDEHIRLAKAFHKEKSNDFDAIRLIHNPLPQIATNDVSLQTAVLDHEEAFPFFYQCYDWWFTKITTNQSRFGPYCKRVQFDDGYRFCYGCFKR